MKVKIGNKMYDSDKEPMMLVFSAEEKELISNMEKDKTKLCCATVLQTDEEMRTFMSEEIDESDELESAKKVMTANGYYFTKITIDMDETMNKCAEGEKGAEDCLGCCCNICTLND